MLKAAVILLPDRLLFWGIGGFIPARPKIAGYFSWLTAGVFASLGVSPALAERWAMKMQG